MKAYVIKNKEGKYYRESDVGLNFTTILSSANMYTDKIDAEMWVKENLILKGCKVQEITICEDDLENYIESIEKINDELTEERYIFKKALELACETINSMMPNKPLWICGDALARKYNIPNTPTIKDYDYFIQQAKESEKNDIF